MTVSHHRSRAVFSLALFALASFVACQPAESAPQSPESPVQATKPAEPPQPRDTDRKSGNADVSVPRLVSFTTSDDALIYADLYGQGDRGVILAHMLRSTKESWKDQAPTIARAGFRVLAIDFRGRGKSRPGPKAKRLERKHYLDILGAARYLRENGCKTIAVVGSAFGGGMAAQAAVESEPGEIDRLVLLGHDPIERPEEMKGSKLFITSRRDRITPLKAIRDQYDRAPIPKQLVVLECSAHAHHIFAAKLRQRLMNEIIRFLSMP